MPNNRLIRLLNSTGKGAWRALKACRLVAAIISATILSGSFAQTSQASERLPGIIGVDNRTPVDSKSLPWSAIGRINRESGGFCTGFLIATNKALTAAHCPVEFTRRSLVAGRYALHFVAGWHGGKYTGHARGVSFKIQPGLSFSGRGKLNHLSDDWAIIELDQPIGAKVGFVPLASFEEGFATKQKRGQPILFTAGYSSDRPNLLQRDINCRPHITISKGPLLMHDCDLTFGASGAPILIRDSDGYRVAVVQVAVVRNAWQERTVAVIPRFDRVLAAR